jgi:hypothetical protein
MPDSRRSAQVGSFRGGTALLEAIGFAKETSVFDGTAQRSAAN